MAHINLDAQFEKWGIDPKLELVPVPEQPGALFPITQLKELTQFLFAFALLIVALNKNGWGKILDLAAVLPGVIWKGIQAFIGIDQVPAEIADMDERERAEYAQFIADEFALENDPTLEKLVEETIVALLAFYGIVRRYVGYFEAKHAA